MIGDHYRQQIDEERASDGNLLRCLVFALLLCAALVLGTAAVYQASRAAEIATEGDTP
jgi:hypothetical protein